MKKIISICVSIVCSLPIFAQDKLKVTVHPGIELFTIVQQLAGKYPPPNPSKYSKEVEAYFSKFKDHPAVKKVASFEKTYTDLVELGWCMSDFPDIKIHEPAETNWYKYYGKESTLEYIRLCKDFFNDTKFWDFYQQHIPRYTAWGDKLKANVDSGKLIAKLQDFYKYDADVQWYICIDPLNNWGSHAIMTKTLNPQFSDWVVYNTGYFSNKATVNTDPVFEFSNFENLVWHEGSHVYVQPLFKKHEKEIEELAYLFNKDDDGMKRNGISNWNYCLNENVVRSVTAALYKKYRTERQFKKQVAKEIVSDFIYVEDLAPFITDKYLNSKKYKNFQEFFPEILKFLKAKYPKK